MKQYTLLNPGPCNVSDTVRAAAQTVDMCHRESEYFECQDAVRSLLLEVFGLDPGEYAPILLTGSGTAAMEATMASAMGPGERLLVINNGVYGDRLARMARAHRVDIVEQIHGWMERPHIERIAATLDGDPTIRAVAVVHHETTTGLVNPLREIADVVNGRGLQLIVDSISGLAGETYNFQRLDPAYTICTANKCVQGLPGISFVLAKRALVNRAANFPASTVYLHLPTYLAKQEQSNTPFTPAIQVVFALHQALLELREETVAGRLARYAEASRIVREGFGLLGIDMLLPDEWRSNTITAFELPIGWTYPQLHDALKDQGFVIYAGQGDLAKVCFRIANMGLISTVELHRLVEVMGDLLNSK